MTKMKHLLFCVSFTFAFLAQTMAVRIQDGSSEGSSASVSSAVSSTVSFASGIASAMREIDEKDRRVQAAKQALFELASILDHSAHVYRSFSACIVKPAKEYAKTGSLDAFERALVRHATAETDRENMLKDFNKLWQSKFRSLQIPYGQYIQMFSTVEEIAVSINGLSEGIITTLATAVYRSMQRALHADPNVEPGARDAEPVDPSSTLGSTTVAEAVGRLRQQLREESMGKVLKEIASRIYTPFLLEEVEKIFPLLTPAMAYLGKFLADTPIRESYLKSTKPLWDELLELFGFSVVSSKSKIKCFKDDRESSTTDLEHIFIQPMQTITRIPLLMTEFRKLFTYEETKAYTVKLEPLVDGISAWVAAFNSDGTKRSEIELKGDMNALRDLIVEMQCPDCPTECTVIPSEKSTLKSQDPQIKHCNKCAKMRVQCLAAQAMFTVYNKIVKEEDKCLMAVVDGVTDVSYRYKNKRMSLKRAFGLGSGSGSDNLPTLTMFLLNGYLIIAEPTGASHKWTLHSFYNILSGGNLAVTVSDAFRADPTDEPMWNMEISVIGQKDPIAAFEIPHSSVSHLQREFVPIVTAITSATVQTSLDLCLSTLYMAGSTAVTSFTKAVTAFENNGGKKYRARWTDRNEATMLGICEAFMVDYSANPLRLPVDWCMDVAGSRGYLCDMFKCAAGKKQEAISIIMGGPGSLLSSQLTESAWHAKQQRNARESIQPRPAQVCDKVKAFQRLISTFEVDSDFGSLKRCGACIWAVSNGYITAQSTGQTTVPPAAETFCNGLRLDGETAKSSCTRFIGEELVASFNPSVTVESSSDPIQVCKSRGYCSSSCSSKPKSTKPIQPLPEEN
eukprot:GILK01002983.1.p1 GENE.GILK01002983.1~~GILK01002983.1.p1  ORF type:complete len:857 (-),score=197.67 GILK01002983.1:268-2814(-)